MPTTTSLNSTLLVPSHFFNLILPHLNFTSLPCTQRVHPQNLLYPINYFFFFYNSLLPSSAAQWRPLAGMNVTGADLLAVLAAGHGRTFRSFLHIHETLLDASPARFGTVRPAAPRLHPATCRGKTSQREAGSKSIYVAA